MDSFIPILQNYWELAVFFLPLGIIGLWRWSVWLFKEFAALFYRPNKKPYHASVSIVTPVYNEDPEIFAKALQSWKENHPNEIIAVIDHTDTRCIEVFTKFTKEFPRARVIITKKPGKRPALADGIRVANSKIVALVDSDAIWTDGVLKNSLCPFNDPYVGGVATRQNVLEPKTIAQKIFDIQLDHRYFDEMPFLSAAGGTLTCLSGRTAFYRRDILIPLLDEMVNETFWGKQVISGEDKRLTYLVEAVGWKVAYQNNAQVLTVGEEKFSTFFKQRLRWTRNSWRADLRAMWQGWVWKHPAFAFHLVDRAVQPFALLIGPIYFVVSIAMGLWVPALVILVWWHLSRLVKLYPHLRRKPKDITILPFYIVVSFLSAIIKIYALFTLNTQGWITRWDSHRLPKLRLVRLAPAYTATFLILLLLVSGVFTYKQNVLQTQLLAQAQTKNSESPKTNSLPESLVYTSDLTSTANPQVLGASTSVGGRIITKYEVKPNDSLVDIAKQFNINLQDLIKFNASVLPNPNIITSGLILNVPLGEIPYSPVTEYKQKSTLPKLITTYNPKTNTIEVKGRGKIVTLSDIRALLGNEYIKEVSTKEWYLSANLHIGTGVSLKLNKNEVEWLKLESNKDGFVWLRTFDGRISIDGVKVTSWDKYLKSVDKKYTDGRSYILAKHDARMDITNAELAYLGYFPPPTGVGGSFGVSWKIKKDSFGQYLVTGEVRNSKFHHNYYGSYTFGATGMVWQGNEFYENVQYGLDPHDDSNNFLVENNKAYNNGNHGIIFSIRCFNNLIRNNLSYNNKGHGIMLHGDSNNNTVENNTVYGNTDGIALYNSSQNVIKNNKIYNNQRGLRANTKSQSNSIESNQISENLQYGIYLYGKASSNLILKNTLSKNPSAIYIKTDDNELEGNIIDKNGIGVYLLGNASDNRIVNNQITNNSMFGIYTKTLEGVRNILSNNVVNNNGEDFSSY